MKQTFLSVCMNPTLQKTLTFADLVADTVNRAVRHRLDASGKGINVSRVLTQLGKKGIHLTQLGGSMRPLFLDLCARDRLNVEWVESRSPIRFCYTLLNQNNGSVTELVEEGEPVDASTGELLLEAFDRILPKVSTVIISGSKAAGFQDSLISEMVRRAKSKALKVIVDIRGKDLLECLQWKPDIVKPNLFEFASTFAPELIRENEIPEDFSGGIRAEITRICRELHAKYGSQIILTRGSKAVWYFENGGIREFPIEPLQPVNTIGSGDAFTAGIAAALEDGASLREAVAEGARCGKLNAALIRPGVIQ